jgi:hypothetical protein
MSDQLDYVNSCIEKAQHGKLNFILRGDFKADNIEFIRGYLKALQDIIGFQKDYIELRNPPRAEEE